MRRNISISALMLEETPAANPWTRFVARVGKAQEFSANRNNDKTHLTLDFGHFSFDIADLIGVISRDFVDYSMVKTNTIHENHTK